MGVGSVCRAAGFGTEVEPAHDSALVAGVAGPGGFAGRSNAACRALFAELHDELGHQARKHRKRRLRSREQALGHVRVSSPRPRRVRHRHSRAG
ncbi:MAG: hypothetical protein AVDCRST_MAG04-392 [uncultured Acetobacteraceae bacterium]|uniref:Uncharacterized protein n=1 Tax=uncultured Acetobacteraceae bacterium TaxID=169975 RepID=A0A6J4H9V3_9PROT|nr:MAG: hypothetical protein AVDCRST_MAG04-392 [uncultured Acetobacteraceae bacterium]